MKKKIYYQWASLPERVRFRNADGSLIADYDPWKQAEMNPPEHPYRIDLIFATQKLGLYPVIEIKLNKSNDAYYRDPHGQEKHVVGWINLAEYADGGPWAKDPMRRSKKA